MYSSLVGYFIRLGCRGLAILVLTMKGGNLIGALYFKVFRSGLCFLVGRV